MPIPTNENEHEAKACRDKIPAVMKCEGCGRFTRAEDLTPDYDLILLCPRCIDGVRGETIQ